MAPAASIHAATSGAAATSKRPAASDAEQLVADSSALPQFDLGAVNASAAVFSSWPSAVVPDFFDGIAPWDDGMGGAACVTGAWGDIAGGLELSWLPPPGN
ncbi:hypothetical protein EJB05_40169 [Eragrostis curvula]|uniref:Uncharacterized protein n=1 Tax=Eragrostis curvula TaxID=38414 RepID=A0A5J9TZK1_9POAL|nr:hypothetical protein EJB05_40169 [Eragrostis curvula]